MTEKNKNSLVSVARSNIQALEAKTQKSFLEILDDATTDYSEIELTDEETAKIEKQLKKMSIGASAFSLLHCAGASCPFASRCELVQMRPSGDIHHGKAPVGQSCPLEASMFRDATASYLKEYDVHPNNFTEFNIVTELAEIEVLQWRLNMTLSLPENATLVIDQVVSIDPVTGQPITQQQVSPIFEQKTKLANRKTKLVKLMVGDRQEKYKKEAALKQKTEDDASTSMSKIKKDLQRLQQNISRQLEGPVLEGEVITPDDLIGADDIGSEPQDE